MSDPARVTLNDVAAASGVSRATASSCCATPRTSRSPPPPGSGSARRRATSATCRTDRARPARGDPHGSSCSAIDSALDGNYARSYIGGLDAELAAHEHVLLVRYAHAA